MPDLDLPIGEPGRHLGNTRRSRCVIAPRLYAGGFLVCATSLLDDGIVSRSPHVAHNTDMLDGAQAIVLDGLAKPQDLPHNQAMVELREIRDSLRRMVERAYLHVWNSGEMAERSDSFSPDYQNIKHLVGIFDYRDGEFVWSEGNW